jgi:hypothetical protein
MKHTCEICKNCYEKDDASLYCNVKRKKTNYYENCDKWERRLNSKKS